MKDYRIKKVMNSSFNDFNARISDNIPLISTRHPIFIDGRKLKGRYLNLYDKITDLLYKFYGCRWNKEKSYWEGGDFDKAQKIGRGLMRLIFQEEGHKLSEKIGQLGNLGTERR